MIKIAGRLLSAQISRFALIGAFGTVLNLLIMTALVTVGVDYVAAALVAGETTIVTNFIMQEKLAFTDHRDRRLPIMKRFLHSFTFNSLEAVARVPFLWVLVEYFHLNSTVAQAGTLAAAFFLRYAYHVNLVYAPPKPAVSPLTDYPEPTLQPSPDPST